MTIKEMLNCIDNIDDKLIVDTEKKSVHRRRKTVAIARLSSLVAVACIILCIGMEVILDIAIQHTSDSIPYICVFQYDESTYEVDYLREYHKKHDVEKEIDKSMIGEILEEDINWDQSENSRTGDLYIYKGVDDKSILVIDDGQGNFYYAIRTN